MKWLPAGILAITFSVFAITLSPGVYLEDSAEFVAAASGLGITHPTGYPLYVLVGKFFTLLPIGSLGYRVNLMSAVFGAAAAMTVYLMLLQIAKYLRAKGSWPRVAGFFLALIFAFGQDFWSQSIVAEVYTLNALMVALFFYVFFLWLNSLGSMGPSLVTANKWLYILAFLSGLGLTNHLLFAFVMPIPWAVIIKKIYQTNEQKDETEKRKNFASFKMIFTLLALFLAGLSVYLYLPIRAAQDPLLNFGNISGVSGAIQHIFRTQYNDLGIGTSHKLQYMTGYLRSSVSNLGLLPVLLGIFGMLALIIKKQRLLSGVLIGSLTISALLPILLRNVSYSELGEFISRVYYFQTYILFLSLVYVLAIGSQKKSFVYVTGLVLFVQVAFLFITNFNAVDLSRNKVQAYYQDYLERLPQNSVYILANEGYDYDSELFILFYLQKTMGVRSDVLILDANNLFANIPQDKMENRGKILIQDAIRKSFLKYAHENYGNDRVIVAGYPTHKYLESSAILHTSSANMSLDADMVRGYADHARVDWDMAYQDFVANLYYKHAYISQSSGMTADASGALVNAIKLDNQVDSEDYRAFRHFRELGAHGIKP